ncbi:hypothetical protein sch_24620 [Serratia plymuthica]|nr:hypothetical protein sch_24620 [Serratia plymuthica]
MQYICSVAVFPLRDDSNRGWQSISALSYFNALFLLNGYRKSAGSWRGLLKKSKLQLVLVATKVLINAQCDQDRIWSAFERICATPIIILGIRVIIL